MTQPPAGEARGFHFLYRSDRGTIDRAVWWRGTLHLAAMAVVIWVGWLLVRPYAEHGLEQPPLVVLGAYVYLLVFSFGLLILLVCEYNLSAKRFTACGRPRALAGILPLSLLVGGAFAWYLPRSQGMLPAWSAWPAALLMAGILIWNIVELGIRTPR